MNEEIGKPKILIVDDTPINLKLLVNALSANYEILVATNGENALRLAETEQPDLILLDIMMPEMDGYEVCRRLKAHPTLQAIPVIFVTAMEAEAAETKGFMLGAVDYVVKPFNVNIVSLRIKNQLELQQYRQHLEKLVEQRTAELEKSKTSAESGNRAKRDFLMIISHELRTPLNQIIGYSDLLEPLLTEGESKKFLGNITKAGSSLLQLIENTIAFVSMEHATKRADCSPFYLRDFLDQLQQEFAADALKKGIQLVWSVDESIPDYVEGDEKRLKFAMQQLIGNAIKFTHEGAVSLEVLPAPERDPPEPPDTVLFKVKDSGIGIAEESNETIFKCFTQIEPVTTRKYGGIGLGLSIVKRCVELMDGRFWHQSQLGKGSVFAFTVHLPPAG
ncbi:MAG: response regulator [Magnetococcales bacterium]|nr:response regulator [Magnetococcales bacterium]MBF0437692.1 response regulator [Magnetococcales bacterium]